MYIRMGIQKKKSSIRMDNSRGARNSTSIQNFKEKKMTSSGMNTQEELISAIEKYFGFKKELIKNPIQHGLWHVEFEVNGIKYAGAISFHGALPILSVVGYTTEKYYHDTPIEDWYYDQFIKGKPIKIIKNIDPDCGEWEDTGIRCKTQEEAKTKISNMLDPEKYWYDIV